MFTTRINETKIILPEKLSEYFKEFLKIDYENICQYVKEKSMQKLLRKELYCSTQKFFAHTHTHTTH